MSEADEYALGGAFDDTSNPMSEFSGSEVSAEAGSPDIMQVAEKFAPEVVYLRLVELEAEHERLREASARVVDEYHKQSEDANDGEFALWRKEDLVNAIIALRVALGEQP